jgi:hypothetical protein
MFLPSSFGRQRGSVMFSVDALPLCTVLEIGGTIIFRVDLSPFSSAGRMLVAAPFVWPRSSWTDSFPIAAALSVDVSRRGSSAGRLSVSQSSECILVNGRVC